MGARGGARNEKCPGVYEARDDFDGGAEFGGMLFGDSGGFDVGAACFPVYEAQVSGLEDEEDDAWDALINLYTLRMFHRLHIALGHAVRSPEFRALNMKTPFYFFANNHDWSPFLVFVHDGESSEEAEFDLHSVTPVSNEVESMADWLEELRASIRRGESLEALLRSVAAKSPGELEQALLQLPELDDGQGGRITLSLEELKNFGGQSLSRTEYYEAISFDAFARLFDAILASQDAGLYDLHASMVYLFLRDSNRAEEYLRAAIEADPGREQVLKDAARNTVRWAGDRPEHRWPNPNLALSESPAALAAMKAFGESS